MRLEKRQNYVTKVAELAKHLFITNDKCNVTGLVLAGSADFKNDLFQSDVFDPRLQAKVIKTVDVSYGGENGFNQAIELCAETLANVKFIQEKRLISKYFEEASLLLAPAQEPASRASSSPSPEPDPEPSRLRPRPSRPRSLTHPSCNVFLTDLPGFGQVLLWRGRHVAGARDGRDRDAHRVR